AAQHPEAGARLAPNLVESHVNLGDGYRAAKQWGKAKAEFDKALKLNPNLAEAHFNLALMYMAAGASFPNMDLLTALQNSTTEFNRYRAMKGPRLSRDDPSENYLRDIERQVEREQRRIERERNRAAQDANRAARGPGGTEGAKPASGGQPPAG